MSSCKSFCQNNLQKYVYVRLLDCVCLDDDPTTPLASGTVSPLSGHVYTVVCIVLCLDMCTVGRGRGSAGVGRGPFVIMDGSLRDS